LTSAVIQMTGPDRLLPVLRGRIRIPGVLGGNRHHLADYREDVGMSTTRGPGLPPVVEQHRPVTRVLNARQGQAVEQLLRAGRLDIRTFEGLCPGVSRRTLQRDLAALERKGLLRHEGDTNNLVYLPMGRW
jgi:hypothetical protein